MLIRLLLTFLCLVFAGCGGKSTVTSSPSPLHDLEDSRALAGPESPAGFPMTVVDGLGREITLPRAPERIVSLAPKNTELLFAIGAGDRVVGVTSYCNYPCEARTREQIGGFTSESQSLEKIIALKPDLIASAGELHWPVMTGLERLGIPIVSLDAESLAGLYHELDLLGHLTGRENDAARVTGEMKRRIERVG